MKKSKIIPMKWVDWEHFDETGEGVLEIEEVMEPINKYVMKELVSLLCYQQLAERDHKP
jgi:hypothetical protein